MRKLRLSTSVAESGFKYIGDRDSERGKKPKEKQRAQQKAPKREDQAEKGRRSGAWGDLSTQSNEYLASPSVEGLVLAHRPKDFLPDPGRS